MSRRHLFAALGLLGATLLLALALWLNHPASLRWLLAQTAAALPGELQVTHMQGSLLGPIQLQGVRYRSRELDVQVPDLALDWSLGHLLAGRLVVDTLTLDGLRVQLHESRGEQEAGPPVSPGWPLPVVDIVSARIDDIEVRQRNQAPFHLDRVALQGRLDGERLQLQRLAIAFGVMQLVVRGQLRLVDDYPLAVDIDWTARRPDQPLLQGQATLQGNLARLAVTASLQQPAGSHFRGQLHDPLTRLRWQGKLDIAKLALADLDAGLPPLILRGQARLTGDLRAVRLREGLFRTDTPWTGPLTARLDLDFADGILRLHDSRFDLAQADTRLWLSGRLDTRRQPLQVAAEGRWQHFRWPLQANPILRSPIGRLRIDGHPDDWRFTLTDTAIDYAHLQSRDIRVQGRGDRHQLQLRIEQARLLDGQVTGSARLGWDEGLHWQARLRGRQLDPSVYPHALSRPLHGRLALAVASRGQRQDGRLTMRLELEKLTGRLRDQPLSGHGGLRLQNRQWHLDDLNLDFADIHLKADGTVGKQWNLGWRLRAGDLAPLLAGARGRVESQGRLSGPRLTPRIQATVAAHGLEHANREGVQALDAQLDVDLAGLAPSFLRLEARDLHYRGLSLARLMLDGRGNRAAHRLQLSARTGADRLTLELAGRVDADHHWRGQLRDSRLQSKQAGLWQQQGAAALDIAADHFRLGPLCWNNGEASLCGRSERLDRRNWLNEFDFRQVPLALLQPLLPEDLQLHGQLDGQARLQVADGRLRDSHLQLQLAQAGLRWQDEDEQPGRLETRQARLSLRQDRQGRYHLETRLELAPEGLVEAKARLEPLTGLPMDRWPLQGRLQLDLRQLDLLRLPFPQLGQVRGRLAGDIRVTGSAAQAELQGNLGLQQAAIEIPALGLELTDFDLALQSPRPGELAIAGQLHSDGGSLALDGRLTLDGRRGWPGWLRITGRDFRVVDLDTAMVRISPDLTVRKDRSLIDIQGTVAIPEADIRSVDVPASVPLSRDVVFVDTPPSAQPDTSRPRHLPVRSRVEIVLGEAVQFEGYGLKGRLTGKLQVAEAPGQITTGQGDLHIVDGQFNAFGVDLRIDIGRILFTGGDITDPGISATATRETGDVTVGVRIRGALRDPQLEVFAIPALPESEALSYLLFGRKTTRTELSGQDFTSTNGGSPLTLGTFLSPRTYVDYVVGVLSPTSVMRMRFKLTDHWELHTESASTHTAADAVYTFEK